MEEPIIPVIVIDKRAVKRRGVCQCVNEAASLDLAWQAGISLRMGFLNAQGQPHMGP